MRKYLLIILMSLVPVLGFSQYQQIPVHYDSENAANEIISGRLEQFLSDSVDWVFEKSSDRFITTTGRSSDWIKSKLCKVVSQGKMEYDDTKVLNYVTFHVDAWSQKIEEIEILLGE
jgi:hypothetical protein